MWLVPSSLSHALCTSGMRYLTEGSVPVFAGQMYHRAPVAAAPPHFLRRHDHSTVGLGQGMGEYDDFRGTLSLCDDGRLQPKGKDPELSADLAIHSDPSVPQLSCMRLALHRICWGIPLMVRTTPPFAGCEHFCQCLARPHHQGLGAGNTAAPLHLGRPRQGR